MKSLTRNILLLLVLIPLAAWGVDYQPIEDGPTHEAYATPIKGVDFLDAVPKEPPKPITETIPQKRDLDALWIEGYWAWDKERADFIWISGVWRSPPPGHEWIKGYWKQFDEGWVWIRGFWSENPENRLTFIAQAPPDAPDENPGSPPNNNYFWNPGYWHHTAHNDEYTWVTGAWEQFDPNWILVPAHYVWRPEGYTFIPAYWDWPFDDRGRAFSCIWIEPDARADFVYEPVVIIEPIMVIRHLFCCYPDYWCYFYHHYHFHPHFWGGFYGTPPWWAWSEWWCCTWHDTWGLWWWWGHPGFPQPWWIDAHLAGIIIAPPGSLIALLQGLIPPIFITPDGLVFPADLLNLLNGPIVPFQQDLVEKLQDKAEPKKQPEGILKPSGKKPSPKNVKKPAIDPNALDNISIDRTPQPLPPIPGIGSETPPSRGDRPEFRPVPPRATTPMPPPRPRPTPQWERPRPQPAPQWERPRPQPAPQWERPRPTPQWERPRPQPAPQWERPRPTPQWERPRPRPQYPPPGGRVNIPDIIDQWRGHGRPDTGPSGIKPGRTKTPPPSSSEID